MRFAPALAALLRARRASSLAALPRAAAPPSPLAGDRVRPLLASTLYVVSTPIGSLRDITLRALDVLAAADAILCEDSRATRRLLTAHGLVAGGDGEYQDAPWDDEPAGADGDVALLPQSQQPLLPPPTAPPPPMPPPPPPLPRFATIAPRVLIGGARADAALARLRQGQSLALVSDAGTPCLSDPGAQLVAAVLAAGFAVRSVPGASAALAALAVSGWDVHSHYASGRSGAAERSAAARRRQRALKAGFAPLSAGASGGNDSSSSLESADGPTASPGFVFLGFLPTSGSARRAQLAAIAGEPGTCSRTVLLFETGARLGGTLRELEAACAAAAAAAAAPAPAPVPPRSVLVCRELTKLHEQQQEFGSLAAAAAAFADGEGAELRGEFTVLIGPRAEQR